MIMSDGDANLHLTGKPVERSVTQVTAAGPGADGQLRLGSRPHAHAHSEDDAQGEPGIAMSDGSEHAVSRQLHGVGDRPDRQPVHKQRAPWRAEDLADRVHHCDVRGDAERTLPRGVDARDQDQAGQDAAAVGPDRNVLLRARRAGPGDHRVGLSHPDPQEQRPLATYEPEVSTDEQEDLDMSNVESGKSAATTLSAATTSSCSCSTAASSMSSSPPS